MLDFATICEGICKGHHTTPPPPIFPLLTLPLHIMLCAERGRQLVTHRLSPQGGFGERGGGGGNPFTHSVIAPPPDPFWPRPPAPAPYRPQVAVNCLSARRLSAARAR
ncbi:hypothetical protein FKM82_028500 [Ascaphus truei]